MPAVATSTASRGERTVNSLEGLNVDHQYLFSTSAMKIRSGNPGSAPDILSATTYAAAPAPVKRPLRKRKAALQQFYGGLCLDEGNSQASSSEVPEPVKKSKKTMKKSRYKDDDLAGGEDLTNKKQRGRPRVDTQVSTGYLQIYMAAVAICD